MPHRRLQDAIEAVSSLAQKGVNVKLLLAGSDRYYPQYCDFLKRLANELGIQDRVAFAGKIANEEIRDFYCACDAFLFPNENQTWGLAVLEAMACGSPVLVSRGAAVHEVLTDNENAILFPPRNPDALAQKIHYLMSQPRERSRIAQAGLTLIRTKYNWEEFARQVSAICSKLAEKEVPSSSLSSTAELQQPRRR